MFVNKTVKIGVITDLHYSVEYGKEGNYHFDCAAEHLREFFAVAEKEQTDFTVNMGDLVWDTLPKEATGKLLCELKEISKSRSRHFTLEGNHDNNDDYYEGLEIKDETQYFSEDELTRLFGQNALYSFYDIGNLRLIFLNTSDSLVLENGVKKHNRRRIFALKEAQLQWLADTLRSAADGKHIIVFSHADIATVQNGDAALHLIKEFLAESRGSISSQDGDFPFCVGYDFSACRGGKLAALVNGHNHKDILSRTDDGFNHLEITSSCLLSGDETERNYGEKSENAFDILYIDTENRTVSAKRFGGGEDRNFSY